MRRYIRLAMVSAVTSNATEHHGTALCCNLRLQMVCKIVSKSHTLTKRLIVDGADCYLCCVASSHGPTMMHSSVTVLTLVMMIPEFGVVPPCSRKPPPERAIGGEM